MGLEQVERPYSLLASGNQTGLCVFGTRPVTNRETTVCIRWQHIWKQQYLSLVLFVNPFLTFPDFSSWVTLGRQSSCFLPKFNGHVTSLGQRTKGYRSAICGLKRGRTLGSGPGKYRKWVVFEYLYSKTKRSSCSRFAVLTYKLNINAESMTSES